MAFLDELGKAARLYASEKLSELEDVDKVDRLSGVKQTSKATPQVATAPTLWGLSTPVVVGLGVGLGFLALAGAVWLSRR